MILSQPKFPTFGQKIQTAARMAIPCQPSGRAASYRLSLGLQGPATLPSTRRHSSPPDATRRYFFGHAMLACRDDGRTRLRFPFTGHPRPSPHCSSEFPSGSHIGRFLLTTAAQPVGSLIPVPGTSFTSLTGGAEMQSQAVPDKLSLVLAVCILG